MNALTAPDLSVDQPMASLATAEVNPHLYVDLDGTLIATDLLHESTLQLLRNSPSSVLQMPAWLLRGKAYAKRQIAQRVSLDASVLPYRVDMLAIIRQARLQGRRVVLATASDEILAEAVAQHLGLFDHVLASNGVLNLSGQQKLHAIQADAGGHPFSYAGNDHVDLKVWEGAHSAVVVSNSKGLRQRAAAVAAIEHQVDVPRANLQSLLYGLRLHQWLKNLLIFLPLLPIIGSVTKSMMLCAVSMFFAFSLCASAIYVFNDLLDLESDRHHHRKKRRPFASGVISIAQAIPIALGLLVASAVLALVMLPPAAVATLLGYVALTTAYSTWLKRRMLVDVFALAMLYTTRILAGSAATQVEPSFWLLGFSMFMFLSLALAKRYVEIMEMRSRTVSAVKVKGRAYVADDAPFILATGLASGQLSILTLSLYLNDPAIARRYVHPFELWLLCPFLLYWLVRVWMKAHRGDLHDDPVVFAATDRVSQIIVAASVLLIFWAS
jgi:4-hydroxybenzoate polyprenyltransferase